MTSHNWIDEDVSMVDLANHVVDIVLKRPMDDYPLRHMWRCGRCSMSVTSAGTPSQQDGFITVALRDLSIVALNMTSDCDDQVVNEVMRK